MNTLVAVARLVTTSEGWSDVIVGVYTNLDDGQEGAQRHAEFVGLKLGEWESETHVEIVPDPDHPGSMMEVNDIYRHVTAVNVSDYFYVVTEHPLGETSLREVDRDMFRR